MIRKLGTIRKGNKGDWKRIYEKYIKIDSSRDQTFYMSDEYPNRSLLQNAYFHGVIIVILSDELGYTREEMKAVLAYKFYPIEIKTLEGEVVKQGGNSSKLNTKRMVEVVDEIRLWAIEEMGIHIPLPNEIPDEIMIKMSEENNFKIK